MKHAILAVLVSLSLPAFAADGDPADIRGDDLKVCRAAERAKKAGLEVSGNVPGDCEALLKEKKLFNAKKRVAKLEAELSK